jgi:choline dehydrogenase-like flavoprotein
LIVIGSGPGGASLAHRLAPTGKRILVLERGGYLPRSEQNVSAQTYSASQTGQIICVYALTTGAARPLMVPLIAHIGQRKTIVIALSILPGSMLVFQHFLTTDTATEYYSMRK